MKKRHLYIYLTLSILMIISSIVLFVLDTSALYYQWPFTLFMIASMVAIFIIIFAMIYQNKKELTKTMIETIDWIRFLSMSLMIVLIAFMFFISSATVSQSSMYPTLENGNQVLIYHYIFEPKRGDIVIVNVNSTDNPNHSGDDDYYVKRVYGCPGDQVTFQYVSVNLYYILINGEIVENPYGDYYELTYNTSTTNISISNYNEKDVIESCLDSNGTIKDGEYLVFGDNQKYSVDSRDLGTIHQKDMIGKVIYKISPLGGI